MLEYNDNIGVDEAGRGPLLGSVVACAVYINKIDDDIFEMVNDSKKLSEKKRELIYDKLISSDSIKYGIGVASEKEIDEINILNATFLAMNRALENLNISDKLVVVDGNKLIKQYKGKQEYLIKGDSKNLSIALASIISKVTRDKMMEELKKLAYDIGVAEKVYFTGYLAGNNVQKMYKCADIAVFPSTYEPFGIVALEAMLGEVPVVVSDVGGLNEIVEHQKNGIKAYAGNANSIADSVLKLLFDHQLCENIVEDAKKIVIDKYNWNIIAESTLKVYKRAITKEKILIDLGSTE